MYCEGTVDAVRSFAEPTMRCEVDLKDGSGRLLLHLRFDGCERIPGVEPGIRMRVDGPVTMERGSPVIVNPLYQFV
jgi:hypothetical protein